MWCNRHAISRCRQPCTNVWLIASLGSKLAQQCVTQRSVPIECMHIRDRFARISTCQVWHDDMPIETKLAQLSVRILVVPMCVCLEIIALPNRAFHLSTCQLMSLLTVSAHLSGTPVFGCSSHASTKSQPPLSIHVWHQPCVLAGLALHLFEHRCQSLPRGLFSCVSMVASPCLPSSFWLGPMLASSQLWSTCFPLGAHLSAEDVFVHSLG